VEQITNVEGVLVELGQFGSWNEQLMPGQSLRTIRPAFLPVGNQ
jgi:hypothetical protein